MEASELMFSVHSLERGLERIFNERAPYTNEQLNHMEKYLYHAITFNPIRMIWVVEDYNAELVTDGEDVITIMIVGSDYDRHYKKVSQLQQEHPKKAIRMGRMRNIKGTDQHIYIDYKGKRHESDTK